MRRRPPRIGSSGLTPDTIEQVGTDRAAAEALDADDPLSLEDGDTVYLCVADASGDMVSLIQSN